MWAVANGPPLLSFPSAAQSSNCLRCSTLRSRALHLRRRFFSENVKRLVDFDVILRNSTIRVGSFQGDDVGSYESASSEDTLDEQNKTDSDVIGNPETPPNSGSSFLAKLAIVLGIAATITILSVVLKQPNEGSSLGTQFVVERSSSSTLVAPTSGFSFNAFGYRVVIPQYAPGWIYFWLLMAAGFGLFISEEALNIWVCSLCWSAFHLRDC